MRDDRDTAGSAARHVRGMSTSSDSETVAGNFSNIAIAILGNFSISPHLVIALSCHSQSL